MQTLKFSVCEQTGRTFEIPLEKAREILQANEVYFGNLDEDQIAETLYNEFSDDILKYEKENCYFESYVQDVEIEGE